MGKTTKKPISDISKGFNNVNKKKNTILNKTTFAIILLLSFAVILIMSNINLGNTNPIFIEMGIGALAGTIYGFYILKHKK